MKLQVLDVKINKMVLNKISSNKFLIIKSAVLKKKKNKTRSTSTWSFHLLFKVWFTAWWTLRLFIESFFYAKPLPARTVCNKDSKISSN